MKTIGITGGIGSGKSIIGKIVEKMGFPVFYSDDEAKLVMNNDPDLIKGMIELLGESAYNNQTLNRPFVAEKLFGDVSIKNAIDNLVHPAVYRAFDLWKTKQTSQIVFIESALMIETGSYQRFDAIILVTAATETKIQRVMKRDGISREKVEERINNQWSDEQKRPFANYIIDNSEGIMLIPQVLELIDQLQND